MNRSNRTRFPYCNRCKFNYNIEDLNGYKVPMLLSCGHDLCRGCLKYAYKKGNQVICVVCSAEYEIKNYEQLNTTPVHYYLVGKVWSFISNKKLDIKRAINNLNMTDLTHNTLKKVKKNCLLCYKYGIIFCLQCNDMYCKDCSEKVHTLDNNHDLERLDNIHSELPLESNICDIHLKLIDWICVTCQLQLCSICAVHDHLSHDIKSWEDYITNNKERFNEYTFKGEILIKNLEHYRNDLNEKMLTHLDVHSKKNNNDLEKNEVLMFVCSLIGALQRVEQNVLDTIDQTDKSIVQSINKTIFHLNSTMEDMKTKLNQLDLMLNNHQFTSATMLNFIADIERTVNTSYFIAKKNKVETSIFFNDNIFDAIKQCIVTKFDVSDTYILTNTLNLPSDYTIMNSMIETEHHAPAPVRPLSSTSYISTSSNHSATSTDGIKSLKLDHCSIKEIIKHKIETVHITHVNSPSDFYLQLHDNKNILKALSVEVNKFIKKKQSVVQSIEMQNIMYAVQLSNDEWGRGVINHTYKENYNNLYIAHFIDYGFTETLSSDKIRKVPESVVTIPPLAYNCALYDLKPKLTTGWSNEAYQLFRDLITQKNTSSLSIYPMETEGERIEVDIICNSIHPISIRDAMLYLGHGSTQSLMSTALQEKRINRITFLSNKMLQEDEVYSIILTHLYSPSEFYFRTNEDSVLLNEIMKNLQNMYTPTENDNDKNYLLYTPQIGMAVAAQYSVDNTWYRAKITSLPESRLVNIYYIDYGNSETLPWDQLRVLNEHFIKIPPLAIKASLADAYPAVEGIGCTNWSDDAIAAFHNLAKTQDPIDDSLTAKILFIDDNSHQVVLYNHTSRGEVCVNSKLIYQGHALDSGSHSFVKGNTRNIPRSNKTKNLLSNSRNKSMMCSTEDTLAFTKSWSIIEEINHTWPETNNSKNVPGIEMSIIKVVSPDEITLKVLNYNPANLIEQMNNVYKKKSLKKKNEKIQWQINDLCAAYIKEFGNWYRGKILDLDTKKLTAKISFYDLDLISHAIPVNSLYLLDPDLIKTKCGFVHCCMDRLVPSGISDNKWPKFSCDRLIEELKKYPIVYFLKTGKKGDIALGEIWVKEIQMPEALQPVRERWINMNKFMIEQGLARSNKQNAKVDEYLTSQSEPELNNTFESLNYEMAINSWLPPINITKSRFKAWVTYVDLNCNIYLQDYDCDSETNQLLRNVSGKLKSVFSNTPPEPINVKWIEGQMVIAKYHLDQNWYRGTIIKIENNETFSVQFLDFGNIETCSHEDLRSTLYMTDIPQLCFKGYFASILPMTDNKKWPTNTLEYLHYLIVEHMCTVTLDLSLSYSSSYAIIKIVTGKPSKDICQLLVTDGSAYFSYVSDMHLIDLTTEIINHGQGSDNDSGGGVTRHLAIATSRAAEDAGTSSFDDLEKTCCSAEKDGYGDDERSSITTCDEDERSDGTAETHVAAADPEVPSDYSRFYLNSNEIVRGTLCQVISPVCMTLMIETIDGIDITATKKTMQSSMYQQCAKLPVLKEIVPGMVVVVFHNFLWRRGTISDDGKCVFLVDLGVLIKLVKRNIRICPAEFFSLPMYSIKCQLANVKKSEEANTKDVIDKMTKLLKGVHLTIIWISESVNGDETIVNVELYNSAGDIAYQPLIDSHLLIPL